MSARGTPTRTIAATDCPTGTSARPEVTVMGQRASVSRAPITISIGLFPWFPTATSKLAWRRPRRRSGPAVITVLWNGCTSSVAGALATSAPSERERATTVSGQARASASGVRGGCRRTRTSCS
jgi:hypothetical protein